MDQNALPPALGHVQRRLRAQRVHGLLQEWIDVGINGIHPRWKKEPGPVCTHLVEIVEDLRMVGV